jgi:hypothetical protein
MESQLEKEFQYYLDNQDELVKKYNGKLIVIKNLEVIGSFDSEIDAIEAMEGKHELGTFIIQKCEHGNTNYTQTFHSRVALG